MPRSSIVVTSWRSRRAQFESALAIRPFPTAELSNAAPEVRVQPEHSGRRKARGCTKVDLASTNSRPAHAPMHPCQIGRNLVDARARETNDERKGWRRRTPGRLRTEFSAPTGVDHEAGGRHVRGWALMVGLALGAADDRLVLGDGDERAARQLVPLGRKRVAHGGGRGAGLERKSARRTRSVALTGRYRRSRPGRFLKLGRG